MEPGDELNSDDPRPEATEKERTDRRRRDAWKWAGYAMFLIVVPTVLFFLDSTGAFE